MLDDIFSFDTALGGVGDAVVDALIPRDTMDFSGSLQDMYFTVLSASTNDWDTLKEWGQDIAGGVLPFEGFPVEAGVSMVIATGWNPGSATTIGEIIAQYDDQFGSLGAAAQANMAIGIGIENITGTRGTNTVRFIDGGQVSGRIAPGPGGSLDLDYQFNNDAAGVAANLASGFDADSFAGSVPGLKDLVASLNAGLADDIPDWLDALFPSTVRQLGNATGSGGGVLGVSEGRHVDGSAFADWIIGNLANNTIFGFDGNDVIDGAAGDDHINGGYGNDILSGGSGIDEVDGGAGNDIISGGDDNDTLIAGSGNDFVDGGAGTDTYRPGASGGDLLVVSALSDLDQFGVFAGQAELTDVTATGGNPRYEIALASNVLGYFQLEVNLGANTYQTNDIAYWSLARDVKRSLEAAVSSDPLFQSDDLTIAVSGSGAPGDPWSIEFRSASGTPTVGLTEYADTAINWVGDLPEVDVVVNVEDIDLTGASLASSAHVVTASAGARTFFLNPAITNGTDSRYDLYVNDTDTIDLKGYGANRVDIQAYANGDQTLVFYASASDKDAHMANPDLEASPQPVLTLVVHGYGRAIWEGDLNWTGDGPLTADAVGAGSNALDDTQLAAIRAEAAARWVGAVEAGRQQAVQDRLDSLDLKIVDLAGGALAETSGLTVAIDRDAAGNGWYVDTTLDAQTADDEFGSNPPAGFDLLTVLMHEFGHALGLADSDADGVLMSDTLAPQTRLQISVTSEEASTLPTSPVAGGLDSEPSDLQKLIDGLNAFSVWAEDLPNSIASSISLPFIGLSLDDLWDVPGGEITSRLGTAIRDEIIGVFDASDAVSSADLIALPSVDAGASGRLTEFQATVGLASLPTRTLDLSLETLKDLGLDLTSFSFLDLSQSEPLQVDVTLDLQFGFGLDDGAFYIEDPSLLGRVTVHHDDPLDVELNVGPIGIGIIDATVFLQAGVIVPTVGRFAVSDLAGGLAIGTPRFDPASSYEFDLPFELLGSIGGLDSDIGRLHGSFNRGDAVPVGGLSLGQFLTSIPENLNFEGNFGALMDLGNISLDAALAGIQAALESALDPDDPNDPNDSVGVAYQKLPFLNQSAVDLLGDGSVDVVQNIINAIATVRAALSDINHVEIDVNREIDRVLKFGLNIGEKGTGVEAAYDALTAILNSLNGQSTDEDVAVALAQRDNAAAFEALLLDRDVVAAADRLAAIGLDETATTLDIAQALADDTQLQALTDDRSTVSGDSTFVEAWLLLGRFGLDYRATQKEVDDLFDSEDAIASALNALVTLADTNASAAQKDIARVTLFQLGVPDSADEAQVRALLNQDADQTAVEAALAYVNGVPQTSLLEAALRLDDTGASVNASDLELASAVAGIDNVRAYSADLTFLQQAAVTPALAETRLTALILDGDSTDTAIALALIDAADYASALGNRDTLSAYDAAKVLDFEYADSVLEVGLDLDFAVTGDYDLNLSLEDLPGLGDVLTGGDLALVLETDGQLHVDADIDFDLNFAFDLSSLGDPKFIIADDSQINFRKLVIETLAPIDIEAGFVAGGKRILTALVDDATISVDLTGTVSLVEDSVDNQYLISELIGDASLWNVDLLGTVEADLPMFFPTASMPLGGTTEDLDGDGIADNVLHVDGQFRGPNDYDLNFAAPGIGLVDAGSVRTAQRSAEPADRPRRFLYRN